MLFRPSEPDHKLSQTELAYQFLLDKILSCEYLPGQDISEKMLYEELSFGRTPIREALVTLKSQNLITVYPRKGMQIRPFTPQYIDEIYRIRKILEPNLIIQYKNIYSKVELLNLQQEFEESVSKDDQTFYQKDILFHMYFVEKTQNQTLIAFYENIMLETYRLAVFAAINKQSDKSANIPQHASIIHALMTEDDRQIAAAVNEHINYSLMTLPTALDRMPQDKPKA